MNTAKFEKIVKEHSLKPGDKLYNSNALCGEAGEVANVVKKIIIRKTLKPEEVVSIKEVSEYEEDLKDELGDNLFYLVRLALDNGTSLSEIMDLQAEKLENQNFKYSRVFKK